ncbi:DUF6088 family protein [Bacillus cereus]|nr:DUF6088 family protein [Bacillus cereus]MDA2079510.1 DUF6088 family protein [Bacillus cereus]MDA2085078.1 DUF6088 family protein [Bacillus cereus]
MDADFLGYLQKNYEENEPIFAQDLTYTFSEFSDAYIRINLKRLYDKGVLKRLEKGVYYFPLKNSILKNALPDIDEVIKEKYLFNENKRIGYKSGINFSNKIGLTTQTASIDSIVANTVADKKRIIKIKNTKLIVRSPRKGILVDDKNYKLLQILDLIDDFNYNSEYDIFEAGATFFNYLIDLQLNMQEIEDYVSKYPLKTQISFYKSGVFYELTQRCRKF